MRRFTQNHFCALSAVLVITTLTIILDAHFHMIPSWAVSQLNRGYQDEALVAEAKDNPRIHLFIPMTRDNGMSNKRFCRVMASAIVNGWEPIVVNWEANYEQYNKGNVYGLRKILSSPAHTHNISDHDVILKMDGSDGWLQLSPETMLRRYKEYGGRIVVGAESTIYPSPPYGDIHPPDEAFPESPLPVGVYNEVEDDGNDEHKRPKFACAGTWMGRLGPLRELLEDWSAIIEDPDYLPGWNDDQGALNLLLSQGRVIPDYLSRLMWTSNADPAGIQWINTPSHPDSPAITHSSAMSNADDSGTTIDDDEDRITPWHLYPPLAHHVVTGQVPVLLHFNWWLAKGNLEDYWENNWWASGMRRFVPIVEGRLETGVVRFATDEGYRTEPFWDVCGMLEEE